MSMTRAEAVEVLENGFWWEMLIPVTTIEGRDDEVYLLDSMGGAVSYDEIWANLEGIYRRPPEGEA